MTPRNSISVEGIVDDRWGHVTTERFVLDDNPRAPGTSFSLCRVDQQSIAVFVGSPLTAEARNETAARRPDWLTAIVFADVVSCDRSLARIDGEIGSPADADIARCAFAAACAAFDAGAVSESTDRYRIRFSKRPTLEVTIEFDEGSESWHGEVSGLYAT
jgi:hypothetical protein